MLSFCSWLIWRAGRYLIFLVSRYFRFPVVINCKSYDTLNQFIAEMKEKYEDNIQLAKAFHYQIIHRSNAGWQRVQSGTSLQQASYVPDIVNLINVNADKLYDLALSLAKAYDDIKKQGQEISKPKEELESEIRSRRTAEESLKNATKYYNVKESYDNKSEDDFQSKIAKLEEELAQWQRIASTKSRDLQDTEKKFKDRLQAVEKNATAIISRKNFRIQLFRKQMQDLTQKLQKSKEIQTFLNKAVEAQKQNPRLFLLTEKVASQIVNRLYEKSKYLSQNLQQHKNNSNHILNDSALTDEEIVQHQKAFLDKVKQLQMDRQIIKSLTVPFKFFIKKIVMDQDYISKIEKECSQCVSWKILKILDSCKKSKSCLSVEQQLKSNSFQNKLHFLYFEGQKVVCKCIKGNPAPIMKDALQLEKTSNMLLHYREHACELQSNILVTKRVICEKMDFCKDYAERFTTLIQIDQQIAFFAAFSSTNWNQVYFNEQLEEKIKQSKDTIFNYIFHAKFCKAQDVNRLSQKQVQFMFNFSQRFDLRFQDNLSVQSRTAMKVKIGNYIESIDPKIIWKFWLDNYKNFNHEIVDLQKVQSAVIRHKATGLIINAKDKQNIQSSRSTTMVLYDQKDKSTAESPTKKKSQAQIKCPKDHILSFLPTIHGSYKCNGCRRKMQKGEKRYQCRGCDFDLCQKCSQLPLQNLYYCPNQHAIKFGTAPSYQTRSCDICRNKLAIEKGYTCMECDFDKCKKCVV